jgi:asparagine synthetase B (glutamine-hydrolysing)
MSSSRRDSGQRLTSLVRSRGRRGGVPLRSLSIGMRRLAVIDIEGGWQPLFSRDGRI